MGVDKRSLVVLVKDVVDWHLQHRNVEADVLVGVVQLQLVAVHNVTHDDHGHLHQ